jgi:serine/threonine-protein kinase
VRTLAAVAFTLAVVLSPAIARAQSASDQATAEALFRQARDLMTAGHYGEACPKLAESQRLDPSAGTMLNLATCYEKNGQLASAWVTFKGAATAAQNANEPDRAKLARARVADLEPKLATLTIAVAPAADVPGLVVKRDGETVGRAGWGVPIPVDPGAHSVEASAPGRRPWQSQAVVEGPAAKASIDVPTLVEDARPPAPAPPGPVSPPPPAPAVPPPPSSPGSTQRVLGVVTGVVGLGGIAVGSVFGLIAKGHQSDAGPHCNGTVCDGTGVSDLSDAHSAATVSTIGFIAGGAVLAGGVVLYLVAPRGSSGTGLVVAPGSAGSVAGLTLRGGW